MNWFDISLVFVGVIIAIGICAYLFEHGPKLYYRVKFLFLDKKALYYSIPYQGKLEFFEFNDNINLFEIEDIGKWKIRLNKVTGPPGCYIILTKEEFIQNYYSTSFLPKNLRFKTDLAGIISEESKGDT